MTFLLCDSGWCVHKSDVQNKWDDNTKHTHTHTVVCVCVFFSFNLDFTAGVTQEEGHSGFLIHLSAVHALIFLARGIQPFLSLVDREVEFCVLTI